MSKLNPECVPSVASGIPLPTSDSLPEGPVQILLSTYQGSRFLAQQLESLQAQAVRDWHLWVRDDGSEDATAAVVRRFAAADPRIELVEDSQGRLGPALSFGVLLERSRLAGARHVMFADQDDVWQPDKIARSLALLRGTEAEVGAQTPILIHSDLAVADERLRIAHRSFLRSSRIRHEEREPLATLMVQNFVTGCTCLMNRALVELASPVPSTAVMHDWWVALCAAAAGRIRFVPDPLVLYRQHGHNAVGARGFWATINPLRKNWRLGSPEAWRQFFRTIEQTRALRQRLGERGTPAPPGTSTVLDTYLAPGGSRWDRLCRLHRLGIGRQEPIRNLYFFLRLLTMPGNYNDRDPCSKPPWPARPFAAHAIRCREALPAGMRWRAAWKKRMSW